MKTKNFKKTYGITMLLSAILLSEQLVSAGSTIYAHAEDVHPTSIKVVHRVSSEWYGGCCAEIELTNETPWDSEGWAISFCSQDEIINLWNGTITSCEEFQASEESENLGEYYEGAYTDVHGDDSTRYFLYKVESADYNAMLMGGGSVSIGYIANGNEHSIWNVQVWSGNEIAETSTGETTGSETTGAETTGTETTAGEPAGTEEITVETTGAESTAEATAGTEATTGATTVSEVSGEDTPQEVITETDPTNGETTDTTQEPENDIVPSESESSEQDMNAKIHVTVVDELGYTVPYADVRIYGMAAMPYDTIEELREIPLYHLSELADYQLAYIEAQSDVNGEVTCEVPEGGYFILADKYHTMVGTYSIGFAINGTVMGASIHCPITKGETRDVTIKLESYNDFKSATIVRVMDDNKTPIEGAVFTLYRGWDASGDALPVARIGGKVSDNETAIRYERGWVKIYAYPGCYTLKTEKDGYHTELCNIVINKWHLGYLIKMHEN